MSAPDFSQLRVLIVDDSQLILELLGAALHAFGVEQIQRASDVQKAFKFIKPFQPNLALCDLHMEGEGGLEFLSMVRRGVKSPNPELPILVVSGQADQEHVIASRDAGANGFLSKPISAKQLYRRIMSVLENPKPFIRDASYVGPCRRGKNVGPPKGMEERRVVETIEVD